MKNKGIFIFYVSDIDKRKSKGLITKIMHRCEEK